MAKHDPQTGRALEVPAQPVSRFTRTIKDDDKLRNGRFANDQLGGHLVPNFGPSAPKEFLWDKAIHGDRERLAQHIGFFYHLSLQGVEVNSEICETLITLKSQGVIQGILGETEEFSLPHFLWMVQDKTGNEVPAGLFDSSLSVMAHNLGLRKSSQTFIKQQRKNCQNRRFYLIRYCLFRHVWKGISNLPDGVVGRPHFLANDRLSLSATSGQLKEERLKPDRLLTSFRQVIDLLSH